MSAARSPRPPRLPWLLPALAAAIPIVVSAGGTPAEWRLPLALALAAVVAFVHPRLAPAVSLEPAAAAALIAALRVACAGLLLLHLAAGARAVHSRAPLAGDGRASELAAARLLEGAPPYAVPPPVEEPPPNERDPAVAQPRPEPGVPDGPAGVLAVAPAVLVAGAAGVRVLDACLWLALIGCVFVLLGRLGVTAAGRWVGLTALLADANTAWRALIDGAGAVRALVPLALALLALGRRRQALAGAAIGVALAVRPIPALAFVPLLLGSPRALLACAAVAGALYLPALAWESSTPFLRLDLAPLPTVLGLAAASWLAWRIARGRQAPPYRELALCALALMVAAGRVTAASLSFVPWLTVLASARVWWVPAPLAARPPSRSRGRASRR